MSSKNYENTAKTVTAVECLAVSTLETFRGKIHDVLLVVISD